MLTDFLSSILPRSKRERGREEERGRERGREGERERETHLPPTLVYATLPHVLTLGLTQVAGAAGHRLLLPATPTLFHGHLDTLRERQTQE